jgi:hypothetical protein
MKVSGDRYDYVNIYSLDYNTFGQLRHLLSACCRVQRYVDSYSTIYMRIF